MNLLWELIKYPREFWFNWQWAAVKNKYPARRVRPVLRFKRGKWKHAGFRVSPPQRWEQALAEYMRWLR